MDELINREGTLDVPQPEYEWIIKDPYVLNLLDLPANEHFYESSLERTPIGHLQKFLLELGYGFSFVTRQKHFNVDGRRFYTQNVCHAGLFVYLEYIVKHDYGRMMYPLYPAPAKKVPPPRESKRF